MPLPRLRPTRRPDVPWTLIDCSLTADEGLRRSLCRDDGNDGTGAVIQLTRLNNKPLAVNSDLIKFIENAPDTVLTLLNGEKVLVRESMDEVIDRIILFRRAVLAGLPSAGVDVRISESVPHLDAGVSSDEASDEALGG